MTKPSDNTGESANAKIYIINNNKIIIIKRGGRDSPEIRDGRSLGSGRPVKLFINPAFHSLLQISTVASPSTRSCSHTYIHTHTTPATALIPHTSSSILIILKTNPWHNQQTTARPRPPATAPSAVVTQRPKPGIAQNERPTSSR